MEAQDRGAVREECRMESTAGIQTAVTLWSKVEEWGSTGRSGSCANRSSSSSPQYPYDPLRSYASSSSSFQIHERVARERSRSVPLIGKANVQIPRGLVRPACRFRDMQHAHKHGCVERRKQTNLRCPLASISTLCCGSSQSRCAKTNRSSGELPRPTAHHHVSAESCQQRAMH